MIEKHVDIKTPGGRMDTFITHPQSTGPHPAVLIYMDAPGIREELYNFARRVGAAGYYCMVPDLYYRQGRVRFDVNKLDDALRAEMRAIWHNLGNAMIMDDTRGLLDFIDAGEPVRPGALGSIGYCMSGQYVLSAAGTFPERFRATATLHGVRHVTDKPDSPHLLAPRFQGELYCGFAEHDSSVPQSEVDQLAAVLQDCTVRSRVEVHPGTEHGYSFPERKAYQRAAAERNWERIFAMFQRQIPVAA